MKTGYQVMEEKGMDMSASGWNGDDFAKAGLPMIVRCTICQMTLALPNAHVDERNLTFCEECAR